MSGEKILLLGAGPTTLATGVRLAQAGRRVKVIERLPWTGGLSKTFQHGPYWLDLGPHRFTPHNREVNDFVSGLLNGELNVVKYQAEIWVNGRLIGYPFRLGELIRRVPPTLSLQLVVPYLLTLLKFGGEDETTYEDWVRSHFGNGVTRHILRPLVEKVWGTPLAKLAPRFARQRIAIASLWEIAVELLTGRRPVQFRSEFYPDNCFLYPPQGFGRIVDRMAEEIQKAGGEIETGATVNEIRTEGGRITAVAYEKDGRTVTETDPAFVMTTIPIQYFFEILKPRPSEAIMSAASNLKTRRLILLYLVLKMDRFSKNTSMYFPGPDFPFGRVWEQKNHSQKTIDVPGRTVLGLEMPCWDSDPVWKEDDKLIFERAIKPLVEKNLLRREDVEEYFTVKLGSVYPVWDTEFERNLGELLAYERGIENLIFNGRPGLFFYNNLHHSLEMGFVAARHILSGQTKAERWDQDRKLFEKYSLVE